jgi:hypothetical protein
MYKNQYTMRSDAAYLWVNGYAQAPTPSGLRRPAPLYEIAEGG